MRVPAPSAQEITYPPPLRPVPGVVRIGRIAIDVDTAAPSPLLARVLRRLVVMAWATECLEVGSIVGAAIYKTHDVIDLGSSRAAASLETFPAPWLLGEHGPADALKLPAS